MTNIKTVLTILNAAECDGDLQSASAFCADRGAHLSALVVSLGSAPVFSEYNSLSTGWIDRRQREIDALSQKAEEVREKLSQAGTSCDVQELYAEFSWADHDVARRAVYADLVLIGRETARDDDLRKQILDGALFQSPTPLIINRGRTGFSARPRSVLLAWDSSNEAARAAHQSIDILRDADMVFVTMVDPVSQSWANGQEPGADVAAYLARHGIEVQVDRIASGGRRADEVLRQHALDVSADLVVMGAYNHPRWQQTLFGGTTRGMIEDSRLPVFLAR